MLIKSIKDKIYFYDSLSLLKAITCRCKLTDCQQQQIIPLVTNMRNGSGEVYLTLYGIYATQYFNRLYTKNTHPYGETDYNIDYELNHYIDNLSEGKHNNAFRCDTKLLVAKLERTIFIYLCGPESKGLVRVSM